jgi:hypothetical protein
LNIPASTLFCGLLGLWVGFGIVDMYHRFKAEAPLNQLDVLDYIALVIMGTMLGPSVYILQRISKK